MPPTLFLCVSPCPLQSNFNPEAKVILLKHKTYPFTLLTLSTVFALHLYFHSSSAFHSTLPPYLQPHILNLPFPCCSSPAPRKWASLVAEKALLPDTCRVYSLAHIKSLLKLNSPLEWQRISTPGTSSFPFWLYYFPLFQHTTPRT